jgi:hypothetical protein
MESPPNANGAPLPERDAPEHKASRPTDQQENNTDIQTFNPASASRALISEAAVEWRRENIKPTTASRLRECDAVSAAPRRQHIRDGLADMARLLEGMTLALLDEADEAAGLYWDAARAIGGDISKTLRLLLDGGRG